MSGVQVPWERFERPQSAILNTLAVGAGSPYPWFWIRTDAGEYGLAFRVSRTEEHMFDGAALSTTRRLKGLKVEDKGAIYIGVVISESELATVFYQLCLDLIDSCSKLRDPAEIHSILKRRVGSWQRLFESGVSRLSLPQCLGLVAELSFLRDHWLLRQKGNGIHGWLGPLGRPQDFLNETELLAVEVKAYSPDERTIKISSIQQLESAQNFYLVCYPCTLSTEMKGYSLPEVIGTVRDKLSEKEQPFLDELLLAYGYVEEPYYESMNFLVGEPAFYSVHSKFPKITPSTVSAAITKAKYVIDLEQISGFRCDPGSF
jgi:hypothetical protein